MAVNPSHVLVEVTAEHKSLLTEPAEVRPVVVGVGARVVAQLRRVGERLATVGAEVRPLAGVVRHVHAQFTGTVPHLGTDRATERPVVRMTLLDVSAQVGDRREHLAVESALEPVGAAAVCAEVSLQTAAPHVLEAAHLTLVRTFSYNVRLTNYNTIEEFNVDPTAECGQHNLAHVARNKKKV